jgi:hypothetical protein
MLEFKPESKTNYVVAKDIPNVAISICMLCVHIGHDDYPYLLLLTELMNLLLSRVQPAVRGIMSRFSYSSDGILTLDTIQPEKPLSKFWFFSNDDSIRCS